MLRIEAKLGFDDFHDRPERFVLVLLSLKVPVAVNLMVVPFSILGFAGLIAIETNFAVDTVSVVDPLTVPDTALMVVLPVAKLLTTPCALMPATAAEDEVQSTDPLISCVLESLKVPVAANGLVVPAAMLEFAGVTAIETSVAAVTVSEAVPLTGPEVAVMVVAPAATPVALPLTSTVAAEVDDELHVTDVSNWKLPSSKLPTAVNCC